MRNGSAAVGMDASQARNLIGLSIRAGGAGYSLQRWGTSYLALPYKSGDLNNGAHRMQD